MPKAKKAAKTYTVEVTATVVIMTSFEIEAKTEEEAKSEAESLLENEIDSVISNMDGYQDYTTESIESEVVQDE